MSTWRVWCVDGDDDRLSSPDSDLFVTWEWVDRWTLGAVIPENAEILIVKKGLLTSFLMERTDRTGRHLHCYLRWNVRVSAGERVKITDMVITVDEGAILLFEEYLPLRPTMERTS